MQFKHSESVPVFEIAELDTVRGGNAINFDDATTAIQQVKKRAAVCRALHGETQRLAGGSRPRAGSDAAALAAATRSCWATIGK
jgi:hypothetical protein